ncbi:MAG: magnesium chelatase, partial [Thermoplasmata archaeon]|nr:magnesium chelatase [Thermoplasmata archaeon]
MMDLEQQDGTSGVAQPKKVVYPFSGMVGQDVLKKALILNIINPNVGGVLIRGDKGTCKSIAVRSLLDILPDILVVEG